MKNFTGALKVISTVLIALLSLSAHAQDRLNLQAVIEDGVNGVDGLEGVWHSTISPDGNHLYAAGFDENKISVFQRDLTTGELTFVEVLENGVDGVSGLGWVGFILVSPDGDYVYAASWDDDAVVVFSRNSSSGELTFLDVYVHGIDGVSGINRATSIAMSQDGENLYVTGNSSNSIATFDRDPSTGLLSYVGRYATSATSFARSVVVSPDDSHVYLAATYRGTVTVFDRDSVTGALTFNEMHEDDENGVDGLGNLFWVALSEDGLFLYTASSGDDALAVFSRDPATGKLTFIEMYKDNENGVEGLNGASSIAISPDGNDLVATAQFDGLTLFERDPVTGQLTFVETHDSSDLNYASGAVFGPAAAPASPSTFAAAPLPVFVYIVAAYSHSASQWKLDPKAPASEDPMATSNASYPQASTHLDPINTFNGELFSHKPTDLGLGGPMPLTFDRYYSSYLRRSFVVGDLGSNWRHNFDARLFEGGDGNMTYVSADGRVVEFVKDLGTGAYDQTTGLDTPYQLSKPGGQDATLYDPTVDRIYTFDFSTSSTIIGKLASVEDGHGNIHTITYDLANGHIDTVADGLGRQLTFTYNNDLLPKISEISDGTRSITFEYTDVNDDEALTIVTDARGFATSYTYEDTSANNDHALMLYMTRPEGNTPYVQTFFDTSTPLDSGKVETQTDADGNTHTFAYNGADTTLTDPLGNTRVHTHTSTGEFSNRQDETALSFSMGSDSTGRRNSITDRLGGTTGVVYNSASGDVEAVTNPDGSSYSYDYSARSASGVTIQDLTGVTHADASTESFVYDSDGNPTAHTDQAGNLSTTTFDSNGQPLIQTNVVGGTNTQTYNADATLATSLDPAGNSTTFGYDALKRLNQLTFADTSTRSLTRDNGDNLLTSTDENGNTVTMTYDTNGNLATVQDALSNTITLNYDGNDRLLSITNSLGGSASQTFNSIGKVASVTDANGNSTNYGHNSLGRRTSLTDPEGNVWATEYDVEAIVSSLTDPLFNTTHFDSDEMGRVTRVTSPMGNTVDFSFDVMGRLATSTDALNKTTTYTRDSRGLLSSVTLADNTIVANYMRDALGNITTVVDPNGNSWSNGYNQSGHLTSSTDPLSNTKTFSYDNRNRVASVTFLGGLGDQTLDYDAAGNLTSSSYSDGTTLTFGYDANNHLTSATGITLNYDANRRLSSSNGIDLIRDPGGRITQMTLAPAKVVTYAYDANDRVTHVTDWLGGVSVFSYDAAGRLTGMTRPNSVDSTRFYDEDSRLIGLDEGQLSSIELTRNAVGEINVAARNVPQATAIATPTETAHTFDAASQLEGASYDAMGRLTGDGSNSFIWDQASRLTSITTGGGTATATYDAAGNRLSRTIGGVTNSYTWNYAFALPSISVEQQDGSALRHYVHTPGGALLYSVDASSDARHFYHYDEMGNTIFVTDDAGDVAASYTYAPFGQLLADTSSLDNPFTWQGQHGVMDEGDGFYYIRARYYDANTIRFISRDPVKSIDPMEISPYQYALNNPLRFVDVLGQQSQDLDKIVEIFNRASAEVATASGEYAQAKANRFHALVAADKALQDDPTAELAYTEIRRANPQLSFHKPIESPDPSHDEAFRNFNAAAAAIANFTIAGERLSEARYSFYTASMRLADERVGLQGLFSDIFDGSSREAVLLHAKDNLLEVQKKFFRAKYQGGTRSELDKATKELRKAARAFQQAGGNLDDIPTSPGE